MKRIIFFVLIAFALSSSIDESLPSNPDEETKVINKEVDNNVVPSSGIDLALLVELIKAYGCLEGIPKCEAKAGKIFKKLCKEAAKIVGCP